MSIESNKKVKNGRLTFVKIQDGESDLVSPGRSLLKSDPVAASAEQVPGSDQVAVASGLELKPGAVPDESLQRPGNLNRRMTIKN